MSQITTSSYKESATIRPLQKLQDKIKNIPPDKLFLLKGLWAYPLFAAALFLVSSMFVRSLTVRISVALVLAFFPWKATAESIYSDNYKHLRTQILILLQVLTTSVSSGYSLEKSFELIRPVIENTFGKKSALVEPLITLENNLKVHVDFRKALNDFSHDIDFPETIPVFHALAISSRIGNNSLAILRSSCQMLSEMNAVQSEISAANAGKNAEAAVLCVMPFAITFALKKMSDGYLDTALDSKVGSVILTAAFVIAILASALLLKFINHKETSKKNKDKFDLPCEYKGKPYLSNLIKRFMPPGFIAARHEVISQLSLRPKDAYEVYLRKQLRNALLTLIFSSFILYVCKYSLLWSIPCVLIMIFATYSDLSRKADLKKEELMQDIPLFLCLTATLLEAGLQLPKAIEICCGAFGENKSLSGEIKNLRAMILSGITASDAVEKMSIRIQIPEAQAALLLVARYGRLGTSEVLNLLSLQASSCWNLCRNAARKKQEREALGLLFPMTLDFVCVLLVAITPAIISLGL